MSNRQVPQYDALMFVAGVLRTLGWIVLILSVVGMIAAVVTMSGEVIAFAVVGFAYAIMFFVGAAFMAAFRDLAINSWHQRYLLEEMKSGSSSDATEKSDDA